MAAGIALVTWLCFMPSLSNTISTWDDTAYLRDNIYIKDLSWQGIMHIFSSFVMGNYHPITILSYAIEFSLVQLDPWLYHFDSLLLHVVITVMVWWFTLALTRQPVAALVTALLFGLHPMHVESVAWVSGRKDLLCGLFYMAACLAHIRYLRATSHRRMWYSVVITCFVLSLLSKGIAVTLPLALLLIDYLENRTLRASDLYSKIPHILLSITIGIVSIQAQHAAGAMAMQKEVFNPLERIALGSFALITYLCKAVVPLSLHCFYPYPHKVQGSLPLLFYGYPLLVIALAYATWRFARHSRIILFGIGFFLIQIALLLQFLPVGEAIVAERYSYLPYLGLFFLAGWYMAQAWQHGSTATRRYLPLAIAGIYMMALAAQSYDRCSIWYSELTLWTDEAEKEPVQAPQAYNNLGYYYNRLWSESQDPNEKNRCFDSAVYFINKAITVKPDFINPYISLGELQRNAGMGDAAKATFFKALALHPRESNIALEIAICYYVEKKMDSAGSYFRKALELDPSSGSYGNLGNYYEACNKDDSALMQYNKAIQLSQTNPIIFTNRAKLLRKMNRLPGAAIDIDTALHMTPNLGELYYLRSFCDTQQHNIPGALADIDKAIALGFTAIDTTYLQTLKKK
jgi:tetratricopeptide (TPR) repeat protein